MTVDGKIRRAIIVLRESAKSLRHSGWNNTAKECESVANELETAMISVDEWGCFDCPDCGAGCHVSWDECAVCGWEIGFSDWPPYPDDDAWDDWLADQNACDNCGAEEFHREEIRSGYSAGSLVEVCSECGSERSI